MAKQVRTILTPEAAAPQMPKPQFILLPLMGRKPIDEIETDLVLLPILSGMKVPRDLHARKSDVGELIKQSIKDRGFEGRRGELSLVETGLAGITRGHSRQVMLAGLGRHDQFCGRIAFQTFQALIKEAIRLEVGNVTIPFAPNRGTGACLTMKGMAHKLNLAVTRCFESVDEPVKLAKLQIYCTPQAKPHIQKGLDIPVDGNCGCRG